MGASVSWLRGFYRCCARWVLEDERGSDARALALGEVAGAVEQDATVGFAEVLFGAIRAFRKLAVVLLAVDQQRRDVD